jgi:thiol-disulfide isomerase/thioredoxin
MSAAAQIAGRHPAASRGRRAVLALALLLTACGSDDAIDRHRGDWVLINYWAEWCKPCIREIPELNALDARDDYTVLGVNYDGATGDELAAQIGRLGIGFATLADDPALRFGVARPEVLPTTLVIDPEGRLRQVLVGPQTEASLLAASAASGN